MAGEQKYSGWAVGAAGGMAAASASVLAALIYFAPPMGDDFCHRFTGLADGWNEIARAYFRVTGRWATTAVHTLVIGSIDLFRGYSSVLAALLALRFGAVLLALRTVLHAETSTRRCAVFAGTFCLFYWSAMPSVGDSLFWLNGALELEFCGTVFLLVTSLLLRPRITFWSGLVTAILVVFLTGLQELAAVAVCVVLAGGCYLAFREKRPEFRIWLALLALAVFGLLVVIGAPGNYVRAARHGTKWNLPSAVAITGLHLAAWLPRWLLDAPVLLMGLLAVVEARMRLREDWNRTTVRYGVLAIWLAVMASGFFLPSMALNGLLPGRVLNWLYFLFVTGLFVNLLLWKAHWGPVEVPRLRSAVLVCAFASVLFAGNAWLGAVDLAIRVRPWHAARSAALAGLQNGVPDSAAELPILPPTPQMYFDYDAAQDSSEYPNRCLARYFGLRSVLGANPGKGPRGAALSGRIYGLLIRE